MSDWRPDPRRKLIWTLLQDLPEEGQGWTARERQSWFSCLNALLEYCELNPRQEPAAPLSLLNQHYTRLGEILGEDADGLNLGERIEELARQRGHWEHLAQAHRAERDACRRSLREIDERLGAGYNGLTLWLERLTAALGLPVEDYSMLELIGIVERRQMRADWPEEEEL